MKSRLFFVFLVGLAGALSCSREAVPGGGHGEMVEVNIDVLSPDVLSKASIGDGSKATDLYYTAFVDGKPVESLQRTAVLSGGKTTLNLSLIKNVVYEFVFWAQAPVDEGATAPYDLSDFNGNGIVKADYSVAANDDDRDAFFAAVYIDTGDPGAKTVELKRPFAQVNFVAADYDELKYIGRYEGLESRAVIEGVPDVLNCRTGEVSTSGDTSVDASFIFALTPSASGTENEYVTINSLKCGYVGMNYVFSSISGDTVTVTGDFLWKDSADENRQSSWTTSEVPDVPVKRNHKTYIYGNFFLENTVLNILIVPGFETPDNIVPLP